MGMIPPSQRIFTRHAVRTASPLPTMLTRTSAGAPALAYRRASELLYAVAASAFRPAKLTAGYGQCGMRRGIPD